ncbi:hypothetical protein [Caenispirillum bisanense]|uniref:Uncharacterized protein n=1 Tax=Caenispirillum bisanense TaxID=414052 RepID=A0A286H0P5_9PROT|nr:hypothetical protein [Caenispirillum bisanense]SOE01370.1 hypothetical protein SAMN05421508_1183 [Caenispirillum bisanense]
MVDPIPLHRPAPAAPAPAATRLVEVSVAAAANDDVPDVLARAAADTAFALTGAMSWDGGWRCRFVLKAPVGVVGDAQVFDLLRCIGVHYRWTGVEKVATAADARRAAE